MCNRIIVQYSGTGWIFYLVEVIYRSDRHTHNRLAITSQDIARGGAEYSEKEEKGC